MTKDGQDKDKTEGRKESTTELYSYPRVTLSLVIRTLFLVTDWFVFATTLELELFSLGPVLEFQTLHGPNSDAMSITHLNGAPWWPLEELLSP